MTTGIEWTDETWNPVTGCTKVSPGCKNCYAKSLHDMRHLAHKAGKHVPRQYATPFETVLCHPERLSIPIKWKKPKRIFVNSMSDLFHEDVPFEFISSVFEVMARTPQHVYQVLTKRPVQMLNFFMRVSLVNAPDGLYESSIGRWPLTNVWLGVSVEDQKQADARIPLLLQTPAAVRFLSCEPLLESIDLQYAAFNGADSLQSIEGIHWVIAGGESGTHARPSHPDWFRSLRDQCAVADVPFFFKQWGEWLPYEETVPPFWTSQCGDEFDGHGFPLGLTYHEPVLWLQDTWYWPTPDSKAVFRKAGKKHAGRLLDGVEHNAFPTVDDNLNRVQ